jgi:hypothetical protein
MPLYSVANTTAVGGGGVQQSIAAAYKTQVQTNNSTATTATYAGLRRGKWYDILIGTNAAPADTYVEWDVVRCTIGTSTAITTGSILQLSSFSSNLNLDAADAAPVAAISINSSVETYLTAATEVWYVGINQRASYRWVAAPGSEIVYPANSSASINGLSLRARGNYTGTVTAAVLVNEL